MSSVFRLTTPQPPLPTDQPSTTREADHIRSLQEVKKVVEKLVAALDPFAPTQIRTGDGKVIRALAQILAVGDEGIAAAAALDPWQPFLSPTATGPNAPFTLRIVPGDVTDGEKVWTAARENIEIVVPPDTKMYVWVEAGVAETARITSFDYGYGSTLPAAVTLTDDGTPPPTARKLLFIISSNATGLEFPAISQLCNRSLSLYKKTISQTAAGSTVVMDWQTAG